MMKKLLGVLMAVCMFIACEDKDNGDPKDTIEVTSGSTTQTIYANQTTADEGQGVTFTTSGPWTSEVRDITDSRAGGQLDWVMLSQTSGDAAGEYTLVITLGMNQTGKDRKAEIRIICGATVITIIVEQKGTTEDGKVLKLVQSVEYVPDYSSLEEYPYDSHRDYVFKYDQQGRIVELQELIEGYGGSRDEFVTTLDYNIRGEIRVALSEAHDGADTWTDKYTLVLDNAGCVKEVEFEPSEYDVTNYLLEYADGRLSRVSWQEYEPCRIDYTYVNGLLSSITEWSGEFRQDSTLNIEEGFSEYPNNLLNIDPNAFFVTLAGDEGINEGDGDSFGHLDRMALLGLVGKRCDRLAGKLDLGEPDQNVKEEGYPTPGTVVTEVVEYVKYTSDNNLVYTFDEDGYIQTITRTVKITKYQDTYQVRVTNELLAPWEPGRGYRGEEIEGTRETKTLGSGENRFIYTFRYE